MKIFFWGLLFWISSASGCITDEILEKSDQYHIKEYFMTTFLYEIQGILVYDEISGKYNFYFLDYFNFLSPLNIEKIVDEFKPVPQDVAMKLYPQYDFNEDNYGF